MAMHQTVLFTVMPRGHQPERRARCRCRWWCRRGSAAPTGSVPFPTGSTGRRSWRGRRCSFIFRVRHAHRHGRHRHRAVLRPDLWRGAVQRRHVRPLAHASTTTPSHGVMSFSVRETPERAQGGLSGGRRRAGAARSAGRSDPVRTRVQRRRRPGDHNRDRLRRDPERAGRALEPRQCASAGAPSPAIAAPPARGRARSTGRSTAKG